MVKWFLVLFILACSAGTVSVAQASSAPFIDVVNTDAVEGDLFARDFRADPSCSGLTLHVQPQGRHTPDSRAAFRVTFYEDKGWFLVEKRRGGFAGGLGVKRHHAVHMTCAIGTASLHPVLVK
jgi:hypothetical protein